MEVLATAMREAATRLLVLYLLRLSQIASFGTLRAQLVQRGLSAWELGVGLLKERVARVTVAYGRLILMGPPHVMSSDKLVFGRQDAVEIEVSLCSASDRIKANCLIVNGCLKVGKRWHGDRLRVVELEVHGARVMVLIHNFLIYLQRLVQVLLCDWSASREWHRLRIVLLLLVCLLVCRGLTSIGANAHDSGSVRHRVRLSVLVAAIGCAGGLGLAPNQSSITCMASDLLLQEHPLVCDERVKLLLGDGVAIQIFESLNSDSSLVEPILLLLLLASVLLLLLVAVHCGLCKSFRKRH